MKRYKQFQPLLIERFEADTWTHPAHQHNHYELIYIQKGEGRHLINENRIPYQSGDLFLLGPDEKHEFEITKTTTFVYIKFTDAYIHQVNGTYGLQQLEYLIKSRETHTAGFQLSTADQHTAEGIINVILSLKEALMTNEPLIWLQVLSLAVLLQRNMPELQATNGRSKDMQAVFCYVHKHIYTPDKLRAAVMAAHFRMSADYIGPYFKRNTGLTLRDYIREHRKNLIEQRLHSGNYSLKAIAAEFGLTDESHVTKIRTGSSTKIV